MLETNYYPSVYYTKLYTSQAKPSFRIAFGSSWSSRGHRNWSNASELSKMAAPAHGIVCWSGQVHVIESTCVCATQWPSWRSDLLSVCGSPRGLGPARSLRLFPLHGSSALAQLSA